MICTSFHPHRSVNKWSTVETGCQLVAFHWSNPFSTTLLERTPSQNSTKPDRGVSRWYWIKERGTDRRADTDWRGGHLCVQFSLGKNTQKMPVVAYMAAASSERSFSRSLDWTRNVYMISIKSASGVRDGIEDTELLYCTEAEVCMSALGSWWQSDCRHSASSFSDLRRYCLLVGRDSSVGIARHYELDGPEIEPTGAIFSTPIQTVPGANPRLVKGVPGLSKGISSRGVALTIHTI